MQVDLTEANEIAKRILVARDVRHEALKAARTARHSLVVSRSNEEARRFPAAQFHVIEKANGKPVGDGSPMPIGFATLIWSQRDLFRTGAFFIQPTNEQGAAMLAWRAAA